MEAALRCFGKRVGLGADNQSPRWRIGLPAGAEEVLIRLMEDIGEQLVWPTPVLLNVVQLIHKSVEADRPITLSRASTGYGPESAEQRWPPGRVSARAIGTEQSRAQHHCPRLSCGRPDWN